MSAFDDYSPSAWQDDGVLFVLQPPKPAQKKRSRRSTFAKAVVSLGFAAVAASGFPLCEAAAAGGGAVVEERFEPPDDDTGDLVPDGYWEKLGRQVSSAPVIQDADGDDLEYLI